MKKFIHKLTAVLVTGALLLLTPGISCYQVLAQEVNGEGEQSQAPLNTSLNGQALGGAPFAPLAINPSELQNLYQLPDVSVSAPGAKINPAIPVEKSQAQAIPALSPAASEGEPAAVGARAQAVPEEVSTVAGEALGAPSAAPRNAAARASAAAAPGAAAVEGAPARQGSLGWLRKTAGKLRGWIKPSASAANLKFESEKSFDAAYEGSSAASVPAASRAASRGRKGFAAKRLAISAAVVAPLAIGIPLPAKAAVIAVAHSGFIHAIGLALHTALVGIGPAGIHAIYLSMNILAAGLALPEVLRTFRRGGAQQAPIGELTMAVVASAIFGLIIGPMKGYWGWAIQNNYGGLSMLAILPIGWILSRGGVKIFGKRFWGPLPAPKSSEEANASRPGFWKRAWNSLKDPVVLRTVAAALIIGVAAVGFTQLAAVLGPVVFPPLFNFLASLFPATAAGMGVLIAAALSIPAYIVFKWLRGLLKSPASWRKKVLLGLPLLAAFPAMAFWLWPMAGAWALPMTADKIVSLLSGAGGGLFVFLFAPEVIRALLVGEDSSKHFNWRTSLIFSVASLGFLVYWGNQYFVNPAAMGVAVSNMIQCAIGGLFSTISFFLAWKHRNHKVAAAAENDESVRAVAAAGELGKISSPQESPPDRSPPAAAPEVATGESLSPHVHENIFGFRGIKGRSYAAAGAKLPPLPARATQSQIIDRISAQFNISRDKVLSIASQGGLSAASPAAQWLAVYDRLQKANYERFRELDHAKNAGHGLFGEMVRKVWARLRGKPAPDSANFRRLANKNYAPGAKGVVQRLAGVHRLIIGFWVGFVYECFDSFILGYFRQAMSFHFRHHHEDFLGIAAKNDDAASAAAENALAASVAGVHGRELTVMERFNATTAGRAVSGAIVHPFIHPLLTFVRRRLVMAILSSVAMGLLGAAAPAMPFLSISVLSVPLLGPLILHGVHFFLLSVAAIPGVGHFMLPIVTKAVNALLKDLVLGPMLNTYVLSFLMALTRRPVRQYWSALKSGSFWLESFKTYLGMMTIGAEIAGCLSYFAGIDSAIDSHGFYQLVGRHVHEHFHVFHALGSAVESPKGQSLIPFGGAITWGNALLYHFENAAHFNISNWIAVHLNPAALAHGDAHRVFEMAVFNPIQKDYQYSAKDYLASPAKAAAHLKQMDSNASFTELRKEMAAAEAREHSLNSAESQAQARILALKKQLKRVTPQEEEKYQKLRQDLQRRREAAYVQDKLAEKRDLKGPDARNAARLRELTALKEQYANRLNPKPTDKTDYRHSLGVRESLYKSIAHRISETVGAGGSGGGPDNNAGALPPGAAASAQTTADAAQDLKAIRNSLDKIKTGRQTLQAEIVRKQALEKLMDAEARLRQIALDQRRDGKAMQGFHQSLSQLDSVMGLALSQNELNAALKAINQMQTLINNKDQTINQSISQDQANLQQIQQLLSQEQQQWSQQANAQVNTDNQSQSDMQSTQGEAASVLLSVQNFSQNEKSLIAAINAADGGASGNALTEYARRLSLIQNGTIAQWETSGGNPNVTFTVDQLNGYLQEITAGIQTAQQGIQTLDKAPQEFAETAILEAPGPAVSVPNNPSKADILNILTQRQSYWQGQLSNYESLQTTIQQLADPNNHAMTQNIFGDSEPQSLPVWKSQEQTTLTQDQSKIGTDTQQMDKLASAVNAAFGSNLPMLSGQSLTQLQNEVQNYGNDLTALKMPSGTDPKTVEAKMDLISLAYLVSDLGNQVINASVAQQTITTIDSAMTTTLPQAAQGIAGIVQMVKNILADEQMDVAYVNGDRETQQQVFTRKENLLQNEILPPLKQAQTMLQNDLLPFQQQTVASYQKNNSTTGYYYLYTTKQSFMNQIENLYNTTLPWSIETFGGTTTDKAGSIQDVNAWKNQLQGYLTGYTDSSGVKQQGLQGALTEVQDRMTSNFHGDSSYPATETQYGEVQPFSLPDKITKYTAEEQMRATQINQNDAKINQMVQEIKTLSNGQYDLTQYLLPVGVAANASGVTTLTNLANAGTLPAFGTALQKVANEALAASGSTNINIGGGNGSVLSGTQPSPTISNDQKIALLASEIGPLLVPASQSVTNPSAGDTTDAVARFLYSNAVIQASQTGEQFITATALPFINQGIQTINDALTDANNRLAYVNSGGSTMTAAQVYQQEINIFNELNGFLQKAVNFYGQESNFDAQSLSTISTVLTYYQDLETIDQNGITAAQGQLQADQTISQALQAEQTKLQGQLSEINTWLSQLDDPHDSALRRTSDAISAIMDQTEQVLEQNIKFKDLQSQLHDSDEIIQAQTRALEGEQKDVETDVQKYSSDSGGRALPAQDAQGVQDLKFGQGMWEQSGKDGSFVVVPKSQYPSFVQALLKTIAPQDSNDAISQVAQNLISNPANLMGLIPGSQVMNFGNSADGFYLVYQTNLSIPNGVSTGSSAILGNVAKIFGNNISLEGYQFESPPESSNAPWGDKGVGVQVESLQGKNWVNYLNIDLHRFGLSVPTQDTLSAQTQQDRILVFDDYAMMAMNGKLYIGLAGFGDGALHDPQGNPYYYGGNLKTSIQMNEVMSLTAQQQELFANDPRSFLENVNLDFTGLDPSLNQNFAIAAQGDSKSFSRTKLGTSLDVARWLAGKNQVKGDAFTLNLFYDRIKGTDDISQNAVGASILKGFTLRSADGKPWLNVTNNLSGEAGQKYDMASDNLAINLANGIVLSADGQIMGSERAYYGQIAKKMSDTSQIQLGYGSPIIGMNNRLNLTFNSSFSLRQIWDTVSRQAATDVQGGEALKPFKNSLADFFSSNSGNEAAAELQKVFNHYAAQELVQSDAIGDLSKQISDLQRAGAFMNNTKVQSVLGFTSGAVSNDSTELAVGGGPAVGTETTMAISRTQKALIADKTATLIRDGLQLQDTMVGAAQKFQEAVKNVVEAEGALRIAQAAAARLPAGPQRDEAQVQADAAQARLRQAIIRFNVMTGRNPGADFPLENLNGATLEDLMAQLKQTITMPDGLANVLHQVDPQQLQARVGKTPFNILDKIPWVERMTLGVGTQLQDSMSSQLLGIGGSVLLPIYDPTSKAKNHAYKLENQAALASIAQVYQDHARAVESELLESGLSGAEYKTLRPNLTQASQELARVAAAYRNGLAGPAELQKAYQSWMWYYDAYNDAMATKTLADASAALAGNFLSPGQGWKGAAGLMGPDSPPLDLTSLDQALKLAQSHSGSLEEMAAREKAAQAMTQAAGHRIQKIDLDLSVGGNLVASGTGWLPSIGMTGFPVMPIFNFKFEPSDLRDLDQAQHKGESDYYAAVKDKLRTDLAFEIYQNILTYQASISQLSWFNDVVIPNLEKAAAAAPSGPAAAEAQRQLDEAKLKREQVLYSGAQALTSVNMLLGRAPSSPLNIDIAPSAALASIVKLYQAQSPAAIQKAILASQVQITRAAEAITDRGEKVQELSTEPVSLIVRAAGRLVRTLSGNGLGDPNLKEQALLENLKAQRALDSFQKNVPAQRALLQRQILAVNAAIEALPAGDKTSVEFIGLNTKEMTLQAQLASLGPAAPSAASTAATAPAPMPGNFAELRNRLEAAEQNTMLQPDVQGVGLANPQVSRAQPESFTRYYYLRQTLGKTQVHEGYVESWLEARLRSSGTPPKELLQLEKIKEEEADQDYQAGQAAIAAQGDILAADFAAKVETLRYIEDRQKALDYGPDGQRQVAQTITDLRQALKPDTVRIATLLGLPLDTVGTTGITDKTMEALMALVPNQGGDAQSIGENLIARLNNQSFAHIQQMLFGGRTPNIPGTNGTAALNDIRADLLLEKMSSANITPVAAFGVFRGQPIEGLFLKTPDPTSIEAGLESVLSQDMLAKLKASGQLQDLTLHLSQLMQAVHDDAQSLESQRRLIQSAQAEYEGLLNKAGSPQPLADIQAAQSELIQAWITFSNQAAKSKSDLIELSGEIQALGYTPDQSELASPAVNGEAQPEGASSQDLLAYWSTRMADKNFAAAQEKLLDGLGNGQTITPAFRERLAADAQAWTQARDEARTLRAEDIPAQQKAGLLISNDAAGRQQAVEQDLAALLSALSPSGSASLGASGDLGTVLEFVERDLNDQADKTHNARVTYNDSVEKIRETYWTSMDLPADVAGSFKQLEALQGQMRHDWQALLDGYMQNGTGAEPFIMKDVDLDAYLKDQHAFNQEIIALLKSKDVQSNAAILQGIESLYDVRSALNQEMEVAQYGRGMAALDALIELDQVRLDVARGENKAPEEIGIIAQSLQTLQAMKQRWLDGEDSLQPVYAVLSTKRDGQGVPVVQEWLTQKEIDARMTNGQDETTQGAIVEKNGKFYLEAGPNQFLPIRSGVDAAQGTLDKNESLANLGLSQFDFVPETLVPGRPGSYTAEQVFGLVPPPADKAGETSAKQPAFFFFQVPAYENPVTKVVDALGRVLPEAVALQENPQDYVTYVYNGPESLSYDQFPTLASLKDSAEYKDFQKLDLTLKGAAAASQLATNMSKAELRKGWVALKLNSYGFALSGQGQLPGQGQVVKVYQTQADFEAAQRQLQQAKSDLELATQALKRDGDIASQEKAKFKKVEDNYTTQLAKYQTELSGRKQKLEKQALGYLAQTPGESDFFYKLRVENKVDALIKGDAQYQGIEKELDPFAKKYEAEKARYDAAQAQVDDDTLAMKKAGVVLQNAGDWSLYKTDDLSLELAKSGELIGVKAAPVYGKLALNESLGTGMLANVISGPLYAVIMNRDGDIVNPPYQDSDALEKAAKNWEMQGVVMQGESGAIENGGLVKTNYRLDYYEDPATHLPVELSERYLRERVQHDKRSLFYRAHWGFMPQNWLNLVMEVPNEIVGTPIEIAGRDPRQEHYLGRINMNHEEGGETPHYGFFRRTLGFVDVLDLLPDPVKIYNDPSQFPAQSRVSSPVLPGQDIYSKSLKDSTGKENVHFGAQAVAQGLRYSLEDLADAQQQTLSYFQGGYEDLIISRMRGRDGTYEQSEKMVRSGGGAISSKLQDRGADDAAYDPLAAADPRSAMNGLTESASPDNVLTERVERDVRVRLGAQQYDQAAKNINAYSSQLKQTSDGAQKTIDAQRSLAKLKPGQELTEDPAALQVREDAENNVDKAWKDYYKLESRIATEKALESAVGVWQKRANDLAAQLKQARNDAGRIAKQLQNAMSRAAAIAARRNAAQSALSTSASPMSRRRSNEPEWPLILILGGLLSLLAAAWEFFRLRRPRVGRID